MKKLPERRRALYRELQANGLEVLYDDRVDQTAGVKLNDADLLGLPVRLVVSPRNVRAGAVEIKRRTEEGGGLGRLCRGFDQGAGNFWRTRGLLPLQRTNTAGMVSKHFRLALNGA